MEDSSGLSSRYWVRYLIILVIWVLILGVAFQGSSRLNDQIESSTNIISTDTEAAEASQLYNERFNQTGEEVQHIVLLKLDESDSAKITDTDWSNYTYYLSLYLFSEMEDEGYDSVLSAPLVEENFADLPNTSDIASEFISEDETTGMIFLSSSTLSFEEDELILEDHVHEIRALLGNYEGLIEYVSGIATTNEIPPQVLLDQIPSEAEMENLTQILTGTAANVIDTLEVSEESFAQSEIIAAIVVTIVLFLVFRTPLGVAIPIISSAAALFPAYLISSYLGQWDLIVVNSFLPAVIAMIGIAVAVDYNLFMLVRYREEYRKRRAKLEEAGMWNPKTRKETEVKSSRTMNKTAGSAIMYSGFTVAIGFSALLLTENEFTGAMAIGVTTVVLLSVITARTLTPAILAFAGRFLDWPNLTSRARSDIEKYKGDELDLKGFWEKWSKRVMNRPIVFLLIGLLTLAPFVALSSQTQLSFSLTKSLPAGTESREGFETLQDKFNLGELNPYQIVIDSGSSENSIWSPELITAVNNLARDVMDYSGYFEPDDQELTFESVTSLSVLENSTTGEQIYLSLPEIQEIYAAPDGFVVGFNGSEPIIQPNYLKALYIDHSTQYINWNIANNTMIVEITSNLDPGSAAAWELVDVIEQRIDEFLEPLVEDGTLEGAYISGFTASIKQSSDRLYEKVPLMLTVAIILIFIALMILFRSIILPLKAILTIGGSILFGLGAIVFVFELGYAQLIEIFGYTIWEAEHSGITYFLPTFLFTTILGLGMDYSIFIISRIKEEYQKSGEMGESVGIGLSKTAGVVTSAATIMTLTFMVFALSPMLTLKMMGLAMSIAIIVDATIARTILLPAAMKLAGKYNFWIPKWLEKILPRIELEH